MGVVAVIVVVLIVLAWFVWPAKAATNAGQPQRDRPEVDEAELEAAERDVQDAPDEESVRDWGPGTGQKPLP
jgi:hypothetical protein